MARSLVSLSSEVERSNMVTSRLQTITQSREELIPRGSIASEVKIYTVEIDSCGCGKGAGFTVIGPDGVEECAVYNDRGAAEEIAQLMNFAYEQGRRSAA